MDIYIYIYIDIQTCNIGESLVDAHFDLALPAFRSILACTAIETFFSRRLALRTYFAVCIGKCVRPPIGLQADCSD